MEKKMIKGSRILLESLKRLGVDTIFGYPGGSVIPIYDEIYSFEGIDHYFSRHEQGSAHEADGYARASGKVGVCLATSGPGATNLVTGIMTAHMDSTPMIAITGQVASSLLGKDAFQESDIIGITVPITKTNYLVQDIRELPRIIKESYFIASTLLGLGGFPSSHSLALGMIGMHGTVSANYAAEEADLVIAAGIRFDDRITGNPDKFCSNAEIIHIDIDPAENRR